MKVMARKLRTIAAIFQNHDPQRASAICASILCRKFSFRGPFGTINAMLLDVTFKDATSALDELGIPFVLAFGTALGLRRDGRLIPYDGDVDFVVFQDALSAVSRDPDVRDRTINAIMARNAFEPRSPKAAPWYHAPGHWPRVDHVPLLYQYVHTRTGRCLDIYVFAEHGGCCWSYSAAGNIGFPASRMVTLTYKRREYAVFPDRWLAIMYGDWQIPKKNGGYAVDPRYLHAPGDIPRFTSLHPGSFRSRPDTGCRRSL